MIYYFISYHIIWYDISRYITWYTYDMPFFMHMIWHIMILYRYVGMIWYDMIYHVYYIIWYDMVTHLSILSHILWMISPMIHLPEPPELEQMPQKGESVTFISYHIIWYGYDMDISYHIIWYDMDIYIYIPAFFCDIDTLISYHISFDISHFVIRYRPLV